MLDIVSEDNCWRVDCEGDEGATMAIKCLMVSCACSLCSMASGSSSIPDCPHIDDDQVDPLSSSTVCHHPSVFGCANAINNWSRAQLCASSSSQCFAWPSAFGADDEDGATECASCREGGRCQILLLLMGLQLISDASGLDSVGLEDAAGVAPLVLSLLEGF